MRWGLFFLLILLFFLLAYFSWIAYTQYRARQAGLPPPPWKSYIPFTSASSSLQYRDTNFPTPRRGGLVGWLKDRVARLRNRRTAHGSYEGAGTPLGGTGYNNRGARNVDADEAWDARMGNENEGPYGAGPYYEEQELELGLGAGARRAEPYEGGGYTAGSATRAHAHAAEDLERGRSRSREPQSKRFESPQKDGRDSEDNKNPFADDAEASQLRGVSPRPDTARSGGSKHDTERRSMFRESL
ncbi:hypothetical protein AJ80_02892 [Polytolypa hystricis UAMH7299]|uniref:Uncharacterized protein n=1 Tax=Polytolypa hystricis (strain UAMH7299) TaxID=1447883 RepID=A0A2B7YQQ7_POLH7|nr:hypothetical protein AJ80_02892 [Polytolypa hystricis UAMH7299]